MTLQLKEAEMLRDALLSAFTIQSFEQMLFFKLGKNYQEMVPPMANKRDAVLSVIRTAEMEGWTDELVYAARDYNPGNPRLKEFTHYFARNFPFGHRLASAVQTSGSFAEACERASAFFAVNDPDGFAQLGKKPGDRFNEAGD